MPDQQRRHASPRGCPSPTAFFWRHCRSATDLAGAESIVEFYRQNGPTGLFGSTLIDNEYDQFQIGGYVTLLAGMRVPHDAPHIPSDEELGIWETRRRQNREMALQAMTVNETLAALRSPGWKWGDPRSA